MSHFFAFISRLRLIHRWGLMRTTLPENDAEHSLQVAMIAHGLAIIGQQRFGRQVDPAQVVTLAVYHDASEVITGDLPTPVKYHSKDLRKAYLAVEREAQQTLLHMLPDEMRAGFSPYIQPDESAYAFQLVKAADTISAYVKCLEEQQAGNHEFDAAAASIRCKLEGISLPEVQAFVTEFLPSFQLPLDALTAKGAES